ncbi:MAG TPA: GMC family oxidoreductase [Actinomycetota bacterium]|nr:GMC family oxidoreductase [Actinomycetota bacterium]
MSRLSLPITSIRDRYDVVVVGSGYGASIAASRLARAGRSVCVLERGKEFRPGEYPDTGPEAAAETQVNARGHHLGPATGLLDFHVNDDLNVLVGCGLGGTSLINANVSLRAEPRVFDDSRWPQEIRDDLAGGIEAGYQHAVDMLKPVPYPDDFPPLAKLEAQRKSAEAMGRKFYRPPINVTFKDGVNHVGVPQKACRLVGDCVSGCNYSAKNTLIMNYLPDAVNHGAEIFTKTDVRRVQRVDGEWLVYFDLHDSGREYFSAPPMFVRAGIVVIGAGALGSTEILLRSRLADLAVSDRLGYGFSGNGDVLGFGYNNDVEINGIGLGAIPPEQADPVGPTITGIIDVREQEDLEDGFVIEEGAIPGALRFFLPAAFAIVSKLGGKDTDAGDWWLERKREAASLLGGADRGAIDNTQTYLVMAHDGSGGRLELDENQKVRVVWPGVGAQPVFRTVNDALEQATAALGGTYVKNPTWSPVLGQDLVTVHPLGGCVMADDAEHGVTNHKGQVFSGKKGTDAYPGLYVMDGSVIPRSVGVNPLLTICAVAERNVALLAKERGWEIDYSFPPVPAVPDAPQKVGIQFTESMKGYFAKVDDGNYEAGLKKGTETNSPFEFVLTVISDDVDRLLDEPEHEAAMVGTVRAPALSGRPLTVSEGRFNLFVDVDDSPVTKKMIYNMTLTSEEGKRYRFSGFKTIRNDPGLDVWPDTTTLYITVYGGDSEDGEVLGNGILKILPDDFLRQMTTMHANSAKGVVQAFGAVAKFGKAFAGDLLEAYGGADKLFRNAG